jgi:hypothetical protein
MFLAILCEREKLVKSIARFIAGLKSKYFTKYKIRSKVFFLFIDGKTCPFCGKVFSRKSGLVSHIIRKHSDDVLEIVESKV